MITPECYAVGWIITAFSSVYQYTARSYLVDWFWERFVLWGWAEFYKLVLLLLQIYRVTLCILRMNWWVLATISVCRSWEKSAGARLFWSAAKNSFRRSF